ncbi:MAG: GWxTD domain-containing protein, partial [Thermoanaerobaculum sp.]|nr:GWxTD domain-containing protein [Thermoanaerobaculum sp.]MDW7968020.1 GWxTD domain-containing protein [Thermoanaerobaculum sp.]
MSKKLWTVLISAGFGVGNLGAEAPPAAKDILKSPVGYLVTKDERKALERLPNDAEVAKFMELFWAKRDPDLNTQVNEFKLDFEARVKAADKMFSFKDTAGSLTDRGRVLILLGRPSRVSQLPAGAAVQGARGGEAGRSPYEDRGASEVWVYTKDRIPQGLVKAEEVWAVFIETRVGSNEFILDRTDPRNVAVMKLLVEMPETLVKNPKLTEVPRLGLLPGSKAARPEELALLEQGEIWPEGALSFWAQGVLSPHLHPLWL